MGGWLVAQLGTMGLDYLGVPSTKDSEFRAQEEPKP